MIRAYGFVNHHDDDDRRIFDGRKAYERANVFCARIGVRPGINLLRRACLARCCVTIQLRKLRRAVQRHALKHPAQSPCSLGANDAMLLRLCCVRGGAFRRSYLAD